MNFIEYEHNKDIDIIIQNKITALCVQLTDRIINDSAYVYSKISEPFYVGIPNIGYYTIQVDLEDPNFIYDYIDDEETGTALRKTLYEKLQSLDVYLLLKICKHYYSLKPMYKELKGLLFDKTLEDNKKLKEQVNDLTGQLEDFKALFNDVNTLNNQKS